MTYLAIVVVDIENASTSTPLNECVPWPFFLKALHCLAESSLEREALHCLAESSLEREALHRLSDAALQPPPLPKVTSFLWLLYFKPSNPRLVFK